MRIILFILLSISGYAQQKVKLPGATRLKSVAIDVPAIVTDHRYGADFTFTQQTDTRFLNSAYPAELFAFKNNIKLGIFSTTGIGTLDSIGKQDSTGAVKMDVYFQTASWKNPITNVWGTIPSYNNTTWQTGSDTYFDITPGAAKLNRTPNHGQQMYDSSGGDYGFDFTTNTMGASGVSEYIGSVETQKNVIGIRVGRAPSVGSYQNGETGGEILGIPHWLGMRNSSPIEAITYVDNGQSYYGESKQGYNLGWPDSSFTRTYWASYPSTTRFGDMGSRALALEYVGKQIDTTIKYKGWYRDFFHWHSLKTLNVLNYLDSMLQEVNTHASGKFFWSCHNGEAVEYMYARECVGSVSAVYDNSQVTVSATYSDPFTGTTTNTFNNEVPTELLGTPVSIQINLSGTPMANKPLQASYGKVLNKGSNVYVIELPFDTTAKQFTSVTIQQASDTSGHWITSIPTISTELVGSTLTVTTNIPTRSVLFYGANDALETDYMVEDRRNTLSTTHTYTLTASRDYKVGVISEFGQMKISNVIEN